jgi:hypothetical protein
VVKLYGLQLQESSAALFKCFVFVPVVKVIVTVEVIVVVVETVDVY